MVKILLKAALLVFIILSIYFIVHPAACSNFLLGRVTNPYESTLPAQRPAGETQGREQLLPVGDKPLRRDVAPVSQEEKTEELMTEPAAQETAPAEQTTTPAAVKDTNTAFEEEMQAPVYTQAETDYAIANRYVELEKQYAAEGKTGKDVAKEISATVMEDFELTQEEWETFLQRATQNNLFATVRQAGLVKP